MTDVPPSNPPADWYPDPEGRGQRWWDGAAWTEHIRAERETPPFPSAPAVPMPMSVPSPAMPEGSNGRGRIAVVVAAVVLIGAIVVAVVLLTGRASSKSERVSDSLAKAELHSAQVTLETYATENGGSYTGATVATLQAIEPTTPDDLEMTAVGHSYKLTIPSEDDNSFTISSSYRGVMSFTCTGEGEGGCPVGGGW